METMQAIARRKSSREYTEEQITEYELQTILKAANAAPIGMGKFEEVKMTVIQRKDLLDKFDSLGAKFFGNPDLHPLYGAPTVVLISAVNSNSASYCNAACIVENIALMATDLGLGNVYILGIIEGLAKDRELCKELKVPDGFTPVSAIAIGKVSEPLEERELAITKIRTDYIV